jgi:hypothetical protein
LTEVLVGEDGTGREAAVLVAGSRAEAAVLVAGGTQAALVAGGRAEAHGRTASGGGADSLGDAGRIWGGSILDGSSRREQPILDGISWRTSEGDGDDGRARWTRRNAAAIPGTGDGGRGDLAAAVTRTVKLALIPC